MATIYSSPVVEFLENSWQPLHHESKHITITTFYVLWWSFWISNTHRWTVNWGLWTIMTIFSPTTTWDVVFESSKIYIYYLEGLLKNTFTSFLSYKKIVFNFFCFRLWLQSSQFIFFVELLSSWYDAFDFEKLSHRYLMLARMLVIASYFVCFLIAQNKTNNKYLSYASHSIGLSQLEILVSGITQ